MNDSNLIAHGVFDVLDSDNRIFSGLLYEQSSDGNEKLLGTIRSIIPNACFEPIPQQKVGRPKATLKYMAVWLAYQWCIARDKAHEHKVKLIPIREELAKMFGYSGEREIRKIINNKLDKTGIIKQRGQTIFCLGKEKGGQLEGRLAIFFESTGSVKLTGDNIEVDGNAYIFDFDFSSEDTKKASYGRLSGANFTR